MSDSQRITVFGTGYVGLVTAACLAEVGNRVTCVDIDEARIRGLADGHIPIHEAGLEPLVRRNLREDRLRFTTDAASALAAAHLVFIAVGTPQGADGSADLSQVHAVAATLGRTLVRPVIVVNKSTVPVGTAGQVHAMIQAGLRARGLSFDVDVASNPEFLKEGVAVSDCMKPDRIVIGASSRQAVDALRRLYRPFNHRAERILVMDPRSAELTKYAANAMLAARISFMNEIACIAEHLGADIDCVRRGLGSDPRIGPAFLYAGIGYGGSCFPKDVAALAQQARAHGCRSELLSSTQSVNAHQKLRLFSHIRRHYDGALAGRTFAVWGLAFKPGTDDLREAPSLVLIDRLLAEGARVRAYDPEAGDGVRQRYAGVPGIEVCATADDALRGAHALVLATEWRQFWRPDLQHLGETLVDRVVFDGRNVLDPLEVEAHGLAYWGIGRGRSVQAAVPSSGQQSMIGADAVPDGIALVPTEAPGTR